MECHTLYINCFPKYRGPKFCPSGHQCAKIYPAFAEMMQFGRLGGPRQSSWWQQWLGECRGWVEHRSRVQSFPSSIRAIWSLAGIWDYLREGKYSEARARTAAQGPRAVGARLPGCGGSLWPRTEWPSQTSREVDKGSWLVASELSLEEAPPFSSFAHHWSIGWSWS